MAGAGHGDEHGETVLSQRDVIGFTRVEHIGSQSLCRAGGKESVAVNWTLVGQQQVGAVVHQGRECDCVDRRECNRISLRDNGFGPYHRNGTWAWMVMRFVAHRGSPRSITVAAGLHHTYGTSADPRPDHRWAWSRRTASRSRYSLSLISPLANRVASTCSGDGASGSCRVARSEVVYLTSATIPVIISAQNSTIPTPIDVYPHQLILWSSQNIMSWPSAHLSSVSTTRQGQPDSHEDLSGRADWTARQGPSAP